MKNKKLIGPSINYSEPFILVDYYENNRVGKIDI